MKFFRFNKFIFIWFHSTISNFSISKVTNSDLMTFLSSKCVQSLSSKNFGFYSPIHPKNQYKIFMSSEDCRFAEGDIGTLDT